MKDIPTDDAKLEKWLFQLYEEKDKLLQTFNEKKRFDGQAILENTNKLVSTKSVFGGIGSWLTSFIPFGIAYGTAAYWYFIK